jgi:hypothetical protein
MGLWVREEVTIAPANIPLSLARAVDAVLWWALAFDHVGRFAVRERQEGGAGHQVRHGAADDGARFLGKVAYQHCD